MGSVSVKTRICFDGFEGPLHFEYSCYMVAMSLLQSLRQNCGLK